VWADTINLRVGSWRLGVVPDSPRTAATLRTLLGAYIEQEGPRCPSNFGLRRPRGLLRRRPGVLAIAGCDAFRAASLDPLAWTLAGHLGGVAAAEGDHLTRVGVRAFARGSRVVLVDLDRPALVDDPGLQAAGIDELALWEPLVDAGSAQLHLPGALPDLCWDAAGLRRPPDQPPRMSIVGVVTPTDSTESRGLRRTWAKARLDRGDWVELLVHLDDAGRVVPAGAPPTVRGALVALLGDGDVD